jgi:hypothetical protein
MSDKNQEKSRANYWLNHHIEVLENRVNEARLTLASLEAELEGHKQAFQYVQYCEDEIETNGDSN